MNAHIRRTMSTRSIFLVLSFLGCYSHVPAYTPPPHPFHAVEENVPPETLIVYYIQESQHVPPAHPIELQHLVRAGEIAITHHLSGDSVCLLRSIYVSRLSITRDISRVLSLSAERGLELYSSQLQRLLSQLDCRPPSPSHLTRR